MIRIVDTATNILYVFEDGNLPGQMCGITFNLIINYDNLFQIIRNNLSQFHLVLGENKSDTISFDQLCWRDYNDNCLQFLDRNGEVKQSIHHESFRADTIGKFIANVLDYFPSASLIILRSFLSGDYTLDILINRLNELKANVSAFNEHISNECNNLLKIIKENLTDETILRKELKDWYDKFTLSPIPRFIENVGNFTKEDIFLLETDQGLQNVYDLLNPTKTIILDQSILQRVQIYANYLNNKSNDKFWNQSTNSSFILNSDDFPLLFVKSNFQSIFTHFTKGINMKEFISSKQINVVLENNMVLKFFEGDNILFTWTLSLKNLQHFFQHLIFVFPLRLLPLDNFQRFGKSTAGSWSFWPYDDDIMFHFSLLRYDRLTLNNGREIRLYRPKSLSEKLKIRILYEKRQYKLKNLQEKIENCPTTQYWKFTPRKSYSSEDRDIGATLFDKDNSIQLFVFNVDQNLFDFAPRIVQFNEFANVDGGWFYLFKDQKSKVTDINHLQSTITLETPIMHSFGKESRLFVDGIENFSINHQVV